mmetsp:Transcript_57567/g.182321  ORF Transcript_57567/g.182321 Transcript_57567/m.182321 type:complete len:204 (+) Transcript_57567:1412-2023(+)
MYHRLDVRLVEPGHHGLASWLPNFEVGRDEPLPHDWLEDLRQRALVVIPRVVLEKVPHHDGVGDDEEALGAEGELVHPPEVEVPFLKRLEERLISHEVRELTLAHRDVLAARVGVEVPLADLRDEARESIAEVALAEIERVQGAEGTGSQEQSHSGEWGELCLGNHAGGTSRTRGGGDAPGHLSSEEARAAGNRGGHGAGGSS